MSATFARAETASAAPSAPPLFTALELRVLRLAASGSEQPSTSVEPRLRRFGRRAADFLMARRGGGGLADPRLEALRGYGVSIRLGRGDGLAQLYGAGYTPAHAATVRKVVAQHARPARRRAPRHDAAIYAGGVSLGVASLAGFVAMTGTLLAGF